MRRDIKFNFKDLQKLIRLLKENDIDILHTHLFLADFWGGWSHFFYRKPILVSTLHGVHLLGDWIYNIKQFLRVRFPEYIIAVSKSVKKFCVERLKVPERKIKVIYNGVNIPKLENYNTQKLKLKLVGNVNAKIILNIGSLEKIKGQIYFIKAAQKILEKRRDVIFLIIGEGSLRKELSQIINGLNLRSYIKILGEKDNIDEYLSITDIFVNSSLAEGLSLSVLEAMSFGKCVVASDVGGNKELIVDDFCGKLFSSQNYKMLAQTIEELLCNDEKRSFLGNNARVRIKKEFSQERMIKELENFYLQILNYEKSSSN